MFSTTVEFEDGQYTVTCELGGVTISCTDPDRDIATQIAEASMNIRIDDYSKHRRVTKEEPTLEGFKKFVNNYISF